MLLCNAAKRKEDKGSAPAWLSDAVASRATAIDVISAPEDVSVKKTILADSL